MTREEVKAQLAKCPLEWEREAVERFGYEYLLAERPMMPNFKLSTVAAQLGVVVSEDKLHDALYDVDLTRDAYHIMIDDERGGATA